MMSYWLSVKISIMKTWRQQTLKNLEKVTPWWVLLYRDIYPVDGDIFTPMKQYYKAQSWVKFIELFLPYYLSRAKHPYGGEPIQIMSDGDGGVWINCPVGLARDLQRHYITFRDHIWRSGVLGFYPAYYTYYKMTPLDNSSTDRKVYYEISDTNRYKRLSLTTDDNLYEGQDQHGKYAAGITFDRVTDIAIGELLSLNPSPNNIANIESWLTREGAEVYIYDSIENFILRVKSVAADLNVSMSVESNANGNRRAIERISRDHYTSYLSRTLGNTALQDAKLKIEFRKEY